MAGVVVTGAAMTDFGRYPDISTSELAARAAVSAMADAQVTADQIEMTVYANAAEGLLTGQEMIRGQAALRSTGLLSRPMFNVENACASGSSAVAIARMAVESGAAERVLVVGAEHLSSRSRARSLAVIGTAMDLSRVGIAASGLRRILLGVEQDGGSSADGDSAAIDYSPFMEIYAEEARDYMRDTGATAEDFASVVVKNQSNGALNEQAHYGGEYTVRDVLESRLVVPPLTVLMCAPISDGAAALVLESANNRTRAAATNAVRIAAVCTSTSSGAAMDKSLTLRCAKQAYEDAAVDPSAIDLVELHDATAPAEVKLYEDLGLCPMGEGVQFLRSGSTSLGGSCPVNVSGGLLSRGHPIGATGCAQLVELVHQLRGRSGERQVDGARVALAHNAGGHLEDEPATAVVTVLERLVPPRREGLSSRG